MHVTTMEKWTEVLTTNITIKLHTERQTAETKKNKQTQQIHHTVARFNCQ